VHNYIILKDRFSAQKNAAIFRVDAPMLSGSQEISKSFQIRGNKCSTRGGLVHTIKKDLLSTRLFVAIFRVVAAVHSRKVPPCNLVSKRPSPNENT